MTPVPTDDVPAAPRSGSPRPHPDHRPVRRRSPSCGGFGAIARAGAAALLVVLAIPAGRAAGQPAAGEAAPPTGAAARSVDAWIAWWRRDLPEDRYRFEADRERGLVIATPLPPRAHADAVERVRRDHDAVAALLGEPPATYAVLVTLLDPADASLVAGGTPTLEGRASSGIYVHAERRAMVTDLGRSLRHELAHVLHYRDMERRGLRRPDPLWLQEGLATFAESLRTDDRGDVDDAGEGGPGGLDVDPGRRLELARRRVGAGAQLEWRRLSPPTFRRSDAPARPLVDARRFLSAGEGGYVDAAGVVAWVHAEGRLGRWLEAIEAASRPERPADALALLAAVFGDDDPDRAGAGGSADDAARRRALRDLERRYRRWMLARAPIAIEPAPGGPRLGLRVAEAGPPDGHRVVLVEPGGPAAGAGLRDGDVLRRVGGRAVPGRVELDRALAGLSAGEPVQVIVRRDDGLVEATIVPRPARDAERVPTGGRTGI